MIDKEPLMRLPGVTDRTAVVGRTGSGKTQAGVWILSVSPFDIQPYIVVDYKRDVLIGGITKARELSFKDRIPDEPGIFVIRPLPGQEIELEDWFWRVWSAENTGLFVDEGYSIPPRSPAWRAILTQGRSKHLPVIALSQRPKNVAREVFSEADYFACFQLNHIEDRKTILEYVPKGLITMDGRLPDYYFHWYDVKKNNAVVVAPVPSETEILATFDRRLSPKRRMV